MLSTGLLAAWRKRGVPCQAFKKGPDYIDSAWLAAASGRACRNLDTFLMGEQVAAGAFVRHAIAEGVNLIEGNRGLFDGMDAEGTFSTAALARNLACPVVLILDCTKRTRTVAAAALGCRMLDPEVGIGGVILNRLGTARQEGVIRKSIEQTTGLAVLGAVPRLGEMTFRERHLGLIPPQEDGKPDRVVEEAAHVAESYLDLDGLRSLAQKAAPLDRALLDIAEWKDASGPVAGDAPRIGYFLDSAFHFYYPDNLEALEREGARLVAIDALSAPKLPDDLDGLYIGGGFPEQRAPQLSANDTLREAVRRAAERGLPIYAECGGLMYLGRELRTTQGAYPMAGVFPFSTVLEPKPQGHGYVEATAGMGHPYVEAGGRVRGHEFHYSRPVDWADSEIAFALTLTRGRGFSRGRDGLVYKNTLATFVHVHALSEPRWAESLVRLCRQQRSQTRPDGIRPEAVAFASGG
jgi:cobyrinic acid a,c-diamide synthase